MGGTGDKIVTKIDSSELQLLAFLNLIANYEFNNVSKLLRYLIHDVMYPYLNLLFDEGNYYYLWSLMCINQLCFQNVRRSHIFWHSYHLLRFVWSILI